MNTSLSIRNSAISNIKVNVEKEKLYNILVNATNDELEIAAGSHLKSSTVIKKEKFHNAIGSYFASISNTDDVRNIIINPLIQDGRLSKDVSFTKFLQTNGFSYKLVVNKKFPAIRNSIHGYLVEQAKECNNLIWFYSKKERNLISYGKTHIIQVDNKFGREFYLDISNLIACIKYSIDNKFYDCIRELTWFSRNILEKSLSEDPDSPSDCQECKVIIAINDNLSFGRPLIVSIFPRLSYIDDFLKLKCLISHHSKLSELVTPNHYLEV